MSLSSLLVWRFFCRTVIDAQRPSGETWTSSARRVASSSSGVKGRRARRSASSSVAMGVRSLPRARSSGGAHLPGCQTPVRGCLSRGRLSRLEEVKAAQMCAAGTGGRHEAQVGRADCGALVACACVGGEWLAVQPAVRGELSHPVRRLPAEQEVAAGVEGGERAELRRLMQRLADGDRGAFSPAFALLWPRLRAFAVRYVGAADGEDAAQAALLRVFSRGGEYDGDRDALAWALGIAASECRTLRRQRQRRREEPVPPPERADVRASPEEVAIERDLSVAAEAVLGSLRPMDLETIMAMAGGPRAVQGATFRKRLARALARFRLAWRTRHGSE